MAPHFPDPEEFAPGPEAVALDVSTAPVPESFYCRRCRRALNIRFNNLGMIVEYLHAAEQRGQPSDHRPEPAPLTEIPDPIIECDFCSAPDVAWIYRCANQITDARRITAQVVAVGDYQSRHHAARVRRTDTEHAFTQAWGERWSACEGCAHFIEARDLYGLIGRVVEFLPAKLTRGKHLMRTRGQLHERYSDVFNTLAPGRGRIVPGYPLGIWTHPAGEAP
ncbi:hypothetical protein GCM10029963_72930 [Micromonospora andamanensis]|uniref:hypothetical protein n=1 Tax=Micromonospora andamanensis TaxID=1287068 RepID=UPI001951D002|nr:hypothetical protein [Micromonospora andamanensis]GIJ39730.1 hypothetical protein Vwe01_30550 [Micromonospora andamanensis]